jgi:hypothetical protein
LGQGVSNSGNQLHGLLELTAEVGAQGTASKQDTAVQAMASLSCGISEARELWGGRAR